MTHLVYPGALHTRFHHALGAMHLMGTAVEILCNKGVEVTAEEREGLIIAILLHDIGHGPFSHALEQTIVEGIDHEDISILLMDKLNETFNGRLTTAISIFKGTYPKNYLHQLVSSQLDMDRMDYLNRDSFFTGVSEGVISSDRIIKMLAVQNNAIAVEEKGIYSIEKFLISRRLMYWQVYLHKTVIAAEQLLCKIFKRSRELALEGQKFPVTPALAYFLEQVIDRNDFMSNSKHLDTFALLDDTDVMAAVKIWADADDFVLRTLCHNLINRKLFHVEITSEKADANVVNDLIAKAAARYNITGHEASYFVFTDSIRNNAYNKGDGNIHILMKDGSIKDITLASDNSNLEALSKTVKKHILCYSKDLLHPDTPPAIN